MTPRTAAPGMAPAALCRNLIRSSRYAALATRRTGDAAGWPYVSLVAVASDHQGAPLLMLSTLAEHTRNADADERASLLFDGTGSLDERLTGPRVTVMGRLQRTSAAGDRSRFLARHPEAGSYAGFADFSCYRLSVAELHLVGGFGSIHRLQAGAVLVASHIAAVLAECEDAVVTHMNEDHGEAIALYANRLLGRTGTGWTMTGVDADGADLRQGTEWGRLAFEKPVHDATSVRSALVRLAKLARAAEN